MKIFLNCFFFLFSLYNVLAQNESNYWYFGENAGINFSTGSPVAINDGALVTLEGCATISDEITGNLLFYTDGTTVYNANHSIMPNGFGLNGNSSSTSSAVILKKPGFDNVYIIFTLEVIGFGDGLQYSEVDMTLDGGLGDVTAIKNVSIFDDTVEKLGVIHHSNGTDFWIIIEDFVTNGFKSFLVNSTGIVTPGISSLNGELPNLGFDNGSRGFIKGNIDGDKLAAAYSGPGKVEVYDFNNTTGIVSNTTPISIDLPQAYGIEFSPNSQFLYVTVWYSAFSPNLFQYNLNAGTASDIITSAVTLGTSNASKGALQLGPDSVIYAANHGHNYLGTISSPNLLGASCNYVDNSVTLASGTMCEIGFPTFRNNITIETPTIVDSNVICLGDSITLSNTSFTSPSWTLLDSPSSIISTDQSITVSPNITTSYLVFEENDTVQHTVFVFNPIVFDLGPKICDSTSSYTIDATQAGNVTYKWQDGSDGSVFIATETGYYSVEISNGPCTSIDSVFVQLGLLTIESPQVVVCDSEVDLIVNDSNPTIGYWTYTAPPGAVNNVVFFPSDSASNVSITVPELGEYEFTFVSEDHCGESVTQVINFVSEEPDLNIVSSQQCNFEIQLEASNPIADGVWTYSSPSGDTVVIDNPTNASTTATVSNYGEYTFTYTYGFCEASFSQSVTVESTPPVIMTDQIVYVCDLSVNLNADIPGHFDHWNVLSGPGVLTFSSFDSPSTSLTVTEYGQYSIEAIGCGGSDTIQLTFEKEVPYLTVPDYVECGLQALIQVNNVSPNGSWDVIPNGNENITIDTTVADNQIVITSDSYGSAMVTYNVCDTFASQEIVFMCELILPNVFTPNNDPINGFFIIPRLTSEYYSSSNFVVYNRWGVEVYQNGNYGLQGTWWNGKSNTGSGEELSEGVYFYELQLFNKINNVEENYKGTVHLFR